MLNKKQYYRSKRTQLRKNTHSQTSDNKKNSPSSYFTYALLLLYILSTVISTTDENLLLSNQGLKLPLVGVTVPLIGYYFLSPAIVLFGHLVILRQTSLNDLVKHRRGKKKSRVESLNTTTDYIIFFSLLLSGPVILFTIIFKLASYQNPFLFVFHVLTFFYACYASIIHGKETIKISKNIKYFSYLICAASGIWLLIACDVILMPTKHSITVWLKTHTEYLDNEDAGTVSWIPHIKIDRAILLWKGEKNGTDELAQYSGQSNLSELFMERSVGLDLRNRKLRFLDIQFQVMPRIWAHHADLSGANLSYTRLYGSMFVNTQLNGANLELASLDGSSFMHTTIAYTTFNNTRLKGTLWDSVSIKNSVFLFSDLSIASFYGTSFSKTLFVKSNLTGASFFKSQAKNTHISNDEVMPIFNADSTSSPFNQMPETLSISPELALRNLSQYLCESKIDMSWEYGWKKFHQLQLMRSMNQDITPSLQDLTELKSCKLFSK